MLSPGMSGALLAIVTTLLWGALPVAIKPLLEVLDPFTIVWLRFMVAAVAVWVWMAPQMHRPARLFFSWRYVLLFVLATTGLAANFVIFNTSLQYLSAPASQVVGQAGPVLLIFGGVFILREPISTMQKIGFVVLAVGSLSFFNQHLGDFIRLEGNYIIGLGLGLTGAACWAGYALINKILLRELSPGEVMRVIYAGCAIVLFPLATPSLVWQLNGLQALCLLYCCTNTMLAYGAFTEAMARWEVTKVSAITTMTPLVALLVSEIAWWYAPAAFPTDKLNLLGIIGAFVTVSGALLIALGKLESLRKFHLPERWRKQGKEQV